jgi:hypothetical protein
MPIAKFPALEAEWSLKKKALEGELPTNA